MSKQVLLIACFIMCYSLSLLSSQRVYETLSEDDVKKIESETKSVFEFVKKHVDTCKEISVGCGTASSSRYPHDLCLRYKGYGFLQFDAFSYALKGAYSIHLKKRTVWSLYQFSIVLWRFLHAINISNFHESQRLELWAFLNEKLDENFFSNIDYSDGMNPKLILVDLIEELKKVVLLLEKINETSTNEKIQVKAIKVFLEEIEKRL